MDAKLSRIPAIVVVVCMPLPVIVAILYFIRATQSVDGHSAATLIGFFFAIAYLVLYFPSLFLFEPFAVIASIWYTRRYTERSDEPLDRVVVCWAAVAVHTAALATYLRLGR